MYKAPIEICRTIEDIIQKVVEETDNQVYEAVFRVGVNVDKEELIKALRYDRGQYAKGYADGVREFAESLKQKALANHKSIDDNYLYQISNTFIDKIVDGMVGEE
jgi:hypothetical protein